jgi:hypothetical protein
MKCLHPQSAHSDIICSTEDTEVKHCTIGICLCLISSKKEKDVTHNKKNKRNSKIIIAQVVIVSFVWYLAYTLMINR